MKRTSSSPPLSHAERNAYKYAAATQAGDVTQAERAARGLHDMLSDPKRNNQPLYLKRSADTGDEFLSTVDISKNEKKIDWFLENPLSQTKRAQKRAKAFAGQLAAHQDPRVQAAARAVLAEVTSGRSTSYGGLASSKVLREAMNDLIAALDAAKQAPKAEPLAPPKPFLKDHRSYTEERKRGFQRRPPIPRTLAPDSPQAKDPVATAGGVAAPKRSAPPRPQNKALALCGAPDRPGFAPTTPASAALAVHRYLSEGAAPPSGALYCTKDDTGTYVGVRPAGAEVSPQTAQQGRDDFAAFLHDLCEAYKGHPNDKIRQIAALGQQLAQREHPQDLSNSPLMIRLFRALANADQQAPALQRPQPEQPRPTAPTTAPSNAVTGKPPRQPLAPQRPPKTGLPRSTATATSPAARRPVAPLRPAVGFVNPNRPEQFQIDKQTARALLDSLKGAPANHVLRTDVNRTAVFVDTHPVDTTALSGDQARGARGPADLATCRLLFQLAQPCLQHQDAKVRRMAQRLQDVARASQQNNRAIPNHPGLHQALAVLAQAA